MEETVLSSPLGAFFALITLFLPDKTAVRMYLLPDAAFPALKDLTARYSSTLSEKTQRFSRAGVEGSRPLCVSISYESLLSDIGKSK